ncbi:protein FAR1-RELATED SEQUENCE 5-like [Asparagus officinalis]|uniref:protein FAR1-RELATED SEQUENCE 5-like n=1 Tax=Asparagus officinalis TaxID=4686 RepID=UPI00098DEA39|nr:protein FAR1-RELATED SEQUENCE 5-like [Asparagus officinalis]
MADVHVDSLMTDNVEGSGFVDCSNTKHELEQEKINHVNSIDNGKSNTVEPWIGMEFPTYTAAYDYYNDYAKINGFSVRISSGNYSRKEGKELISKKFVCNKEGLKFINDKRKHGKIVKRRRDTRVGCKAMLRVNRTDKGTWIVSKLVNEHTNHKLTSPDKVKNHYSHRKLHRTKGCRSLIDSLHEEGLPPATISRVINVRSLIDSLHEEGLPPATISRVINVGNGNREEIVTPQQCSDHIRKQRKNNMGNECILVIQKFIDKRTFDPDFYFAIELDTTGTMRSVFWADGRARASFLKFHDVVVFDVTYRTNKLALPFAPFTGVNHHRQSTLFGCALLADEEEDTFVRLFTEWVKCMNGVAPHAIITDQDKAICNAIQRVFPNTRHRYCKWHLGKHMVDHLLYLQKLHGEEFANYFNRWWHSKTVETCIQQWDELKEKFNIEENEEGWLQTMYRNRTHWVPCYLKDTFFAGMTSSQRSESINAFFDTYVNSQTLLPDFVEQYDKAILSRHSQELSEDFATLNTKPVMHLNHPIEIQAGESYTRAIFERFQDELKASVSLFHDEMGKEESISKYIVGSLSTERSVWEHLQ